MLTADEYYSTHEYTDDDPVFLSEDNPYNRFTTEHEIYKSLINLKIVGIDLHYMTVIL